MPSPLVVVPFSPALGGLVAGFSCGDEPHERELAEWIQQDALAVVQRGTSVWLFLTEGRELIGYGSLGRTNWHWPDPTGKKVPIQIIPAVALQRAYWGKPDGPREGRYSSLILDHLIAEATDRSDVSPLLGLFVHPANQRAVKLYERAGFAPYWHSYTDRATGVVYRSMIYELRRLGP